MSGRMKYERTPGGSSPTIFKPKFVLTAESKPGRIKGLMDKLHRSDATNVRLLIKKGLTMQGIADQYGVSRPTLYRFCRRYRISLPPRGHGLGTGE